MVYCGVPASQLFAYDSSEVLINFLTNIAHVFTIVVA